MVISSFINLLGGVVVSPCCEIEFSEALSIVRSGMIGLRHGFNTGLYSLIFKLQAEIN